MRRQCIGLVVPLLLAGCGGLPPADCQIRAGTMQGEAGYEPFAQVAGNGGAASFVGDAERCKNFRVFTRGPNGSVVCYDGVDPSSDWCPSPGELPQPVTMTTDQLRQLVRPQTSVGDEMGDDGGS